MIIVNREVYMEENENKDSRLESEKYYENVKLELRNTELNVTLGERQYKNMEGIKDTIEYVVYIYLNGKDVEIATVDEDGAIKPNIELLEDEKYTEGEKKMLKEMLRRLSNEPKIDMSKLEKQLRNLEARTKEELLQARKEEETIEDDLKEKKPEEGKKEETDKQEKPDPEKEKISKQYGASSKDIVRLDTTNEKLTENETFSQLVRWAEGRTNIYVVANKSGSIIAVVEDKGNGYEEIDHNMEQVQGNHPSVNVNVVGNDKITTVRPLKIYQINSEIAFATTRNEWGELETIYCRKVQGKEEWFGEMIPEDESSNNKRQLDYGEREFLDPRNTSTQDLARAADNLKDAEQDEARGIPSDKPGIQVNEVSGTTTQKRDLNKESIVKDLYERCGITEQMKANLMPGQLQYLEDLHSRQAEEILQLMEEDSNITYEQAVEKIQARYNKREERRRNSRAKRKKRRIIF